MVNTDPLTREKVAKEMVAALPLSLCDGDRQLDNQKDFTGLFVHACMIARGYKLYSYGLLPEHITDPLRIWFLRHLNNPYPTEEEELALVRQTGLQPIEIHNWFANARRRQLPYLTDHPNAEANARNAQYEEGRPQILGTRLPDDFHKHDGTRYFVYTHWTSEHTLTTVSVKNLDDPSDPRIMFEVTFEAKEHHGVGLDKVWSTLYCEVFRVRPLFKPDGLPLQIPHTVYQDIHFRLQFVNILEEGPFHWFISHMHRIMPLLLNDPGPRDSFEDPSSSNASQRSMEIVDTFDVLPPGPPVMSRPSDHPLSQVYSFVPIRDFTPSAPIPDFPPPGFEDEHQMNTRPGNLMTGQTGPRFPIGHDDLHPPGLGPCDPLRPSLTDPSRGMPGAGGMYPSFSPQARPNIRWDPVGPGVPPPEGLRGPQFPNNGGIGSPGRLPGPHYLGSPGGMMGYNNGDFGPEGMTGPNNGNLPPFGGMRGPPGFENRRGGPGSGSGFGGSMGGGFGGGII